jgi:hypothetical protein
VVPQDDLKLLTRLYAAYQIAKGWRSPSIVATLDEAFARLGVAQANFSSRLDRLNRRAKPAVP